MTTTDTYHDRWRPAAVILAVIAPLVVLVTFTAADRFIAAGAYVSLAAVIAALIARRHGDRSAAGMVALVVASVSLIAGIATLALAIGLTGVSALWFMGSA